MSIIETILVFVGIPTLICALTIVAVYGKSMLHQPNRYRPGQPWNFAPQWYVAHPEALPESSAARLTGGATSAMGGASGEW